MTSIDANGKPDDPVEAAFAEFQEAWFSRKRPDPDTFCKKYPECGDALRERIQNFFFVAEGLRQAGLGKDERLLEGVGGGEETSVKTLGDFRILGEIGRGGMGVVYAAEQLSLNRRVALKILSPHLTFFKESVLKFQREAEVGGRQHHEGIIAVYAVGEHRGIHYIAQELVEEGRTLADMLDELRDVGDLPVGYFRKAAGLIAGVADALEHAHGSGVIHRDVKPSNILLTQEGISKVTDFGLARVEDALALSRTGDFAGTPFYMSPEQAACRMIEIDHRTDIFSLGVTLYETLTLARPFDGETSQEILKKILFTEPKDPCKVNPRIPWDLSVICLKAMEKNAEDRYRTMADLEGDLRCFLSGEMIHARPAGTMKKIGKRLKRNPTLSAAAGTALAAFAVLVLYVLWTYPAILAEEKKAIAEERKAVEFAAIAGEKLAELTRLSDTRRLAQLETGAKGLWPAYPEMIFDLERWLKDVKTLISGFKVHQQTLKAYQDRALPVYNEAMRQKDREHYPRGKKLTELKKKKKRLEDRIRALEENIAGQALEGEQAKEYKLALEESRELLSQYEEEANILEKEASIRRTWLFEEPSDQWVHDTLQGLVFGILSLKREKFGLIHQIEARLDHARTIHEESIERYRERWEQAVASIANFDACPSYQGLVIAPQIGLVPLGPDPRSGLFEFAHLQTGEVPERDQDDELVITAESGLVFILIPGGSFDMGAVRPSKGLPQTGANVDPDATELAGLVHTRNVHPFFLSKYEMTQGQWLRFTGETPSGYELGTLERGHAHTLLHPVENVSWNECVRVLHRLRLRLPSEAEWEYAARAGTSTVWWTGDDKRSLEGTANIKDLNFAYPGKPPDARWETWLDDGYRRHAPVGRYNPNPFGLHDVCGNVREWCQDRWHWGGYTGAPADGSPWESGTCPERVIRDGGFIGLAKDCRSAARYIGLPDNRRSYIGLRPARSLE